MTMSIINIIVPIYNVEEYLSRCIDSLIHQTYPNIRIILVNDGSTDSCPKICDTYAKKDSRITVIHQQNSGISCARNSGISYALHTADSNIDNNYIGFVDPDDWVDSDYIEFLYTLLTTYDADIAQCGHTIEYSEKYTEDKNPDHTLKILNKTDAIESLCRNGIWDVTLWNKLYKASLFRDVQFPAKEIYEDTATSYLIANNASRLVVKMDPKYHYWQRYTSLANGIIWKNNKLDFITVGDRMASWINRNYPQLSSAAVEKQVFVRLSTLSQMVNTGYNDKKKISEICQFVLQHASIVLKDRKASKRDKIGIVLLFFGYPYYRAIWKIYYGVKRKKFS